MKALTALSKQFDMDDEQDAEEMENAFLERGMPIITKRLRKGGSLTPSIDFEATHYVVNDVDVTADEMAPKGRQISLDEMLRLMMMRR